MKERNKIECALCWDEFPVEKVVACHDYKIMINVIE